MDGGRRRNMLDRLYVMLDYVKNHEDSTAEEVADGTGYTADQVRNSLRRCSAYNHGHDGGRFNKGQDHSRKGSPIVYWFGPEKLRGSPQKIVLDGKARHEKGVATGRELREVAELIELADGEEASLEWWWLAAEKGDLAAVRWLEDWLERKIEREKGEKP